MYDQQMAEYNNKVAEWQNEYPENNLKPLIKKWLEKFIDGSKDVDFSAQTATNQYNREVFVKQEYESKSSLWKLCYRAGKEATNAGRSFAQKWLSEL
jgi:recombinational DNA repair ATPase RecF